MIIFLIIVHNQHTWYIHINSYNTKTKHTYRRIDRKKNAACALCHCDSR